MGNLVRNALEATREDEPIAVKVRCDESGCTVLVSNPVPEGVEMDLDEMFTMFHTTKAGGSGLGLTIARNLAEACGGELTADLIEGRILEMKLELPHG